MWLCAGIARTPQTGLRAGRERRQALRSSHRTALRRSPTGDGCSRDVKRRARSSATFSKATPAPSHGAPRSASVSTSRRRISRKCQAQLRRMFTVLAMPRMPVDLRAASSRGAQQCAGADVAFVGTGKGRGRPAERRLRLRRGAMCPSGPCAGAPLRHGPSSSARRRPAPATQHSASRSAASIQHSWPSGIPTSALSLGPLHPALLKCRIRQCQSPSLVLPDHMDHSPWWPY